VAASRRLQDTTRFYERHTRQPPRRYGFGTWAVAAQLSVYAVRRTRSSTRERERGGATSLLARRMAVAAKPLAKAELNDLYEVASTSLSVSSTCAAIGGAEVAAVARIRVRQLARANSRERRPVAFRSAIPRCKTVLGHDIATPT
jgi:hypothetical protein